MRNTGIHNSVGEIILRKAEEAWALGPCHPSVVPLVTETFCNENNVSFVGRGARKVFLVLQPVLSCHGGDC